MTHWTTDPANRAVVDAADDLSGLPPPSGWAKWFGGVLVPAVLAWCGAAFCMRQQAMLSGDSATIDLVGRPATAMGIAWLSAAAFFHWHYFWGNLKRLCVFSHLGKLIAVTSFLISFGYVIWFVLMKWE